MQIFYTYDSAKLLAEKYLVAELSFTSESRNIKEINDELIFIAVEQFKKEISSKYTLVDFFDSDKSNEIIEIYKQYFELPEEYFSQFFMTRFSDPNNFKIEWLERNKESVLKDYPEFTELSFQEKDLEKLKSAYMLDYLVDKYGTGFNSLNLVSLYPKIFKGARRGEYKMNAVVRKYQSLHKYFSILDTFDKIDILTLERDKLQNHLDARNTRNIYYREPFLETIKYLTEEITNLNDKL